MKKYIIIMIILVVVIPIFLLYRYNVYKNEQLQMQKLQKEYESFTENEITGTSLVTLINKTIDLNRNNGIELDSNNLFVENDTNSIKIDIKFIDSDDYYPMEVIAKNDVKNFIKNYAGMTFKCTKKEYHKSTNNIKYLLFEEI